MRTPRAACIGGVGVLSYRANEKRSYLLMAQDHIEESSSPEKVPGKAPAGERVISTRELLGDAQRIWIEHAADRYLLQVTRSGKLILTK